jgi:uncharacterized protein (DUF885 family)
MSQYPELATAYGYPGQNSRWSDYSSAAIAAREDYLRKKSCQAKRHRSFQLLPEDEMNYDFYRELLEVAVEGLVFHNDAIPIKGVISHNLRMPMNQLEGVQHDIPRLIDMMPKATLEDYENIVLRLERAAALIDQTIELMRQGSAEGLTPPRIVLRDVPAQVKAQIFEDSLQSPLLEAFKKMPAGIRAAEAAKLKDRAVAAYRNSVVPALSHLHDFLVGTYLPACRETTAAASLPTAPRFTRTT